MVDLKHVGAWFQDPDEPMTDEDVDAVAHLMVRGEAKLYLPLKAQPVAMCRVFYRVNRLRGVPHTNIVAGLRRDFPPEVVQECLKLEGVAS